MRLWTVVRRVQQELEIFAYNVDRDEVEAARAEYEAGTDEAAAAGDTELDEPASQVEAVAPNFQDEGNAEVNTTVEGYLHWYESRDSYVIVALGLEVRATVSATEDGSSSSVSPASAASPVSAS